MTSAISDAATVVVRSLKSFFVEAVLSRGDVDRRVPPGDLDQVLGLITCEEALFSHSAKP